jgi:hypothetical protein
LTFRKNAASIFGVEEQAEQETCVEGGGKQFGLLFDPGDGIDMSLRNVGGFLTVYVTFDLITEPDHHWELILVARTKNLYLAEVLPRMRVDGSTMYA